MLSFPQGSPWRVLDIDSLRIGPGERVAIVGRNGAGKSTLLRLLAGFARPSHGAVTVLGRQPNQSSRGERQKLAIARMLMQRPRLILADEPTAALDPQATSEICALLVDAARRTTLISVVHNPALLPLLADRVIGLKQGRMVFDQPAVELDDRRFLALYA